MLDEEKEEFEKEGKEIEELMNLLHKETGTGKHTEHKEDGSQVEKNIVVVENPVMDSLRAEAKAQDDTFEAEKKVEASRLKEEQIMFEFLDGLEEIFGENLENIKGFFENQLGLFVKKETIQGQSGVSCNFPEIEFEVESQIQEVKSFFRPSVEIKLKAEYPLPYFKLPWFIDKKADKLIEEIRNFLEKSLLSGKYQINFSGWKDKNDTFPKFRGGRLMIINIKITAKDSQQTG